MKKQSIRFLALLLAMLMVLSGCAAAPADGTTQKADPVIGQESNQTEVIPEETTISEEEKEELWVMYDDPLWFVPHLIDPLCETFSQAYPDVAVRVERVPEEEIALQQLRVQIMAGKGPDVYIVSKGASLFADPYLDMANGLFEDISSYYDADEELKKEELKTTIMDAGVYEGRRYILPLFYDMPIAYVDIDQFTADGGSLDMFEGGGIELINSVLATGNPRFATGVGINMWSQQIHPFNFFPEIFDYDNYEVLITKEDVVQFLQGVQSARAAEITENKRPVTDPELVDTKAAFGHQPIIKKETWRDYTSMYIGTMIDALEIAGFAKASGIEVAAIPVTASNGDLVADVPTWGAVGYGCDHIELAYEFLRLFLTEQGQWECCDGKPLLNTFSLGWPVKTAGSATRLSQYAHLYNKYSILSTIYKTDTPIVTDEDITILDATIDRVQFLTAYEQKLSTIINSLNNQGTGEALPVDIDTVAADFIKELEWHLYEG